MTTITRSVDRFSRPLAVFLAAHGVAHWVGTSRSFQDAADGTTVDYLGGAWSISSPTTLRMLGVLWVIAGAAFLVAAWAYWTRAPRRRAVLLAVTVPSLALAILALPMAVVGVVIDVALVLLVLLSRPSRPARSELPTARSATPTA
jgi:hypothetical protein